MNWNIVEGRTREQSTFDLQTIKVLNPKTLTLPSFRTTDELRVATEIHQAATMPDSGLVMLDCEAGEPNPWGIKLVSLFHASGKSGLFRKREDLEAEGWRFDPDMIFRRDRQNSSGRSRQATDLFTSGAQVEEALPLYEGQLVDRFNHRAKTYRGYSGTTKYGKKPFLPKSVAAQLEDPHYEIEPRYWILRTAAENRLSVCGNGVFVGFRDVGAPWRNQRSIRAAILPHYPATHKLPIMIVPKAAVHRFLAVFNSSTFEFLVRGHMPGGSAALIWMLSQLPVPSPTRVDDQTAKSSEQLSVTSQSVAKWFGTAPTRWNVDERRELDSLIDAKIAHLYGLTRQAYETVLDSFAVLRRVETARFGDYRYKAECLAAFDRLG